MVKYNLTKKLQKSLSPTRSLSYQLRIFCRFSCHIKTKLLLILPELYYQYIIVRTGVAILVLSSIFKAKLYLAQTKEANSFCFSLGLLCILFCGQLPINFKRSGGLNITTNYWP